MTRLKTIAGATLACAAGLTLVAPASAEGAHHRRHARHGHVRHYAERGTFDPAPGAYDPASGGPIISGPTAAALISLGIAPATAADGYGYGGYQRQAPYPQGYGYYGQGYLGPSYSYTGY